MSEESERPTGILGAYVVFHDKLSGLYAGLGAFITRHTLWTCLGGILFFGCLTIGLVAAKKETDLEKLWIQTGTRITPEKEFYEAWFGGLTRKQNIAIIDKTNPSVVASTTNLDNWKALLTPLLAEDESTTSDGGLTGSTVGATGLIPNSVSVPKQIKLQSSIGRTGLTPLSATYTQKDFCEAPPVPTVFKPGGSIALAYINIVKCVNAVYPGRLAGNLPPNWGIDRFPCTRTVVLDCFREGNFDYPLRLQQLDFVAGTMFGMYSNTSYNLQNLCVVPTVTALVNASLYAATGNPNIPVAVIQANSNYVALLAGVKSAITNFAGFGYLWRASYATAGDLNKYMYKAITNTKSGLPVTTLIGGRLPSCMTWSASKVGEQLYGGGITIDDAGATVSVAATRMVANNYNSDHPVFAKQIAQGSKGLQSGSSNDRKDLCEAWEGLWQDYLLPKWEKDPNSGYSVGEAASNLNLYFAAWRATDDTIRDGSSTEGGLIIGGYIIIIVYSCVCVSKLSWPCSVVNAVYSRVGLALWGVAAVALATIASFGMMGIIGVNLSPISINLVPFLALGIGIDDMYVLVHTTIYYNTEKTVLSRMKVVFSKCGPAILLTTMSNVVSFFIASITPMRVVQSFAIQMGFALLFNHLTLFFVFGPGLAWDLRRIMLKRTDLFTPPCIELEKPIPAEDDPSISTSGNFITNITAQYIAPACCLWWVKILVFCVIYGFMAATIWNGVVNTQKGLRLSDIALRGTFVREYTDVQEQYFGSYDSYYVTKTVDYTNLGVQQRFVKVIQQLDLSKYRLDAMHTTDLSFFTSSFLPAFNSANTASSTTVYPGAAFYPAFQSYITSTGATRVPEVGCADKTTLAPVGCELFNAANHIVTATKNTIYNKDLFADTQIFLDTMADNRYIADFYSEGDGFMFGFIYQFYQQYTDIDTNLYKVVGYSLIGVFGVAVIFTFSPIASLIMCLVILQVVVQLWGFLAWIDVKLNAFSVVNLSMTVGICVEFTGYVTHSFCVAHGTKNRRMAFAMEEMMAPMANGLLSTFLAVLVLIGARFPFFRKYYFAMFSLQTLIGFVNGMIVLPIWLSLLGPRSMHYKKGEDDQFAGEQGMGMKRLETHDTSQATLTV